MNDQKQAGRIKLRWFVVTATTLPILINMMLIFLFEQGKLGRCDGIWLVGKSFIVSVAIFMLALAGTSWMLVKRQREPLWLLIIAVSVQAGCIFFLVMPFMRH